MEKQLNKVFVFFFSKLISGPTKQQVRWTQDLILSADTVSWSDVYKYNYFVIPETKLKSFQIKLNLRAIVTNIALYGFEIKSTNKYTFCDLERETFVHFFSLVFAKKYRCFGKMYLAG